MQYLNYGKIGNEIFKYLNKHGLGHYYHVNMTVEEANNIVKSDNIKHHILKKLKDYGIESRYYEGMTIDEAKKIILQTHQNRTIFEKFKEYDIESKYYDGITIKEAKKLLFQTCKLSILKKFKKYGIEFLYCNFTTINDDQQILETYLKHKYNRDYVDIFYDEMFKKRKSLENHPEYIRLNTIENLKKYGLGTKYRDNMTFNESVELVNKYYGIV